MSLDFQTLHAGIFNFKITEFQATRYCLQARNFFYQRGYFVHHNINVVLSYFGPNVEINFGDFNTPGPELITQIYGKMPMETMK
jgi:hypothetical protein